MNSPLLLNVFCDQGAPGEVCRLTKLPLDLWHGILRGTHPFPTPVTDSAERRLLLVFSRDNHCLSIDPIKVQVDTAGYLKTLDASLAALPDDVVDLRARFIQRYLERHHAWEPTTPVLLTALQRSNCVLPTQKSDQPQFATD